MTPEPLAREVFDEATRLKATAAEFYLRRDRRTATLVQALEPHSVTRQDAWVLGVRVFLGRRWGLSHTTELDGNALRAAVRSAFALAQLSEEDPHARLVETLDAAPVLSLVDPEGDALDGAKRRHRALEIERGAFEADPRVRSSRYVSFTDVASEIHMANTRGLEASRRESVFHLEGMFGAQDGEEGQQLFGSQSSRRLRLLDPRALGESIARRLAVTLAGRPLPTGRRDVVLDPSQSPVLVRALAQALSGDAVHLGRSYLRDRVGDRVASASWTLVDDPLAETEAGSTPFDDEGVPSARKTLVEAGVLRGYLYDLGSASRAGTVSTGNGLRPHPGSPAGVFPTYMAVEEGHDSLEALLAGVEEGIYVTGFMGRGIEPVTGRVSAAVLGARIRAGALAEPVTGMTLSGTLDALLGALDGVGRDAARQGGFSAPALRFRDVLVVGR